MTTMFTYNQEQAVKAGQSSFINETGAYAGKITLAKWTKSQNNAQSLELSFESNEGEKADYLSIYYIGKNGEPIAHGQNMIQAIMGCVGVKQLTKATYNNSEIAPELTDKRIGLMLQKVLRLKQDGSETHSFNIICPFSATSRKTLTEHLGNKPADRIEWLIANTKDKDERAKSNRQADYSAQNQFYADHERPPQDGFDDDIPF